MKQYQIAVIQYPSSLLSAIYGLEEMFTLSNRLCYEASLDTQIVTTILSIETLPRDQPTAPNLANSKTFHAVLIPPSMQGDAYTDHNTCLTDWLILQHKAGSILCSACAGAFLLAATGLTQQRTLTTHWALAEKLQQYFPLQPLDSSKILINHGDIISAGGMMSWVDLGLELLQLFTHPSLVRRLGKTLVIDTGKREQRYYQQFLPRFDHGDKAILSVQHHLQAHYPDRNSVAELACLAHLTSRTFLRRFVKHTGFKPSEYLQRIRIQAACDALEQTTLSFERVAQQVGYDDVGSCRKAFSKIIGLTPSAFRKRFVP